MFSRRARAVICRLGLAVALPISGCAPTLSERVDALQQLIEAQSEQIQRLRLEIGDGIGMAMCTPELSQLIEDLSLIHI